MVLALHIDDFQQAFRQGLVSQVGGGGFTMKALDLRSFGDGHSGCKCSLNILSVKLRTEKVQTGDEEQNVDLQSAKWKMMTSDAEGVDKLVFKNLCASRSLYCKACMVGGGLAGI